MKRGRERSTGNAHAMFRTHKSFTTGVHMCVAVVRSVKDAKGIVQRGNTNLGTACDENLATRRRSLDRGVINGDISGLSEWSGSIE